MRFHTAAVTLLRVVAGLAFFSHGAQKLFGWFGGFGPDGGIAPYMSRFGAAGLIEVVAGLGIAFGGGARILAFIASGEMPLPTFGSTSVAAVASGGGATAASWLCYTPSYGCSLRPP